MVYVKQWLQLACTSLYVMIYARVYISGGEFSSTVIRMKRKNLRMINTKLSYEFCFYDDYVHFQGKSVRARLFKSIVSLMSLLRGQLVKSFMTLLPNTLIFLLKKMRKACALQKLLTFIQQKILAYIKY